MAALRSSHCLEATSLLFTENLNFMMLPVSFGLSLFIIWINGSGSPMPLVSISMLSRAPVT